MDSTQISSVLRKVGQLFAALLLFQSISACAHSNLRVEQENKVQFSYCSEHFLRTLPRLPDRITPRSANEFIESTQNKPLPYFIMDSLGGNVEVSLALGRYIDSKKTVAIVSTRCHSACLNYVAPATKEIYVCNNGFLSTHGGVKHATEALWKEEIYDVVEHGKRVRNDITHSQKTLNSQIGNHLSKLGISTGLIDCAGLFSSFSPIVSFTKVQGGWKHIAVPMPRYDEVRKSLPKGWAPTKKALISSGYPPIHGWFDDPNRLKRRWIRLGYKSEKLSIEVSESLERTGACLEATELNEQIQAIFSFEPIN